MRFHFAVLLLGQMAFLTITKITHSDVVLPTTTASFRLRVLAAPVRALNGALFLTLLTTDSAASSPPNGVVHAADTLAATLDKVSSRPVI